MKREEVQAREHAATAPLARLDEVVNEGWPVPEHLGQMRVHYGDRVQRYTKDDAGQGNWIGNQFDLDPEPFEEQL